MATASGFTKSRMDSLTNDIIDSASIINDELVLIKRGGSGVNAGNIRGAEGDPGQAGDISEQDVLDAYDSYVPTNWAPLPLSTGWVPYDAQYLGLPSYRVVRDQIRFTGLIQWTNATVPAGGSTYICDALPAAVHPPYDTMGMTTRLLTLQNAADVRYYTSGRLLLVNYIHDLVNNELLQLGDICFSLT